MVCKKKGVYSAQKLRKKRSRELSVPKDLKIVKRVTSTINVFNNEQILRAEKRFEGLENVLDKIRSYSILSKREGNNGEISRRDIALISGRDKSSPKKGNGSKIYHYGPVIRQDLMYALKN